MMIIFFITLLQLSHAFNLKGKVTITNRTELVTDEFVDISIRIIPEQEYYAGINVNERFVPRYKNGTFFISNLSDGKYIIVVQAPQCLEKIETLTIEKDTVISKSFNKGQKILNLKIHPIDFTEEKQPFSLLSLLKNPMIIMAAVSIGLTIISKVGMNSMSAEEARMMKHPDIILANGQRVDPTTLVPSFIEKKNN